MEIWILAPERGANREKVAPTPGLSRKRRRTSTRSRKMREKAQKLFARSTLERIT